MGDGGAQALERMLDALPERVVRYRREDLTVLYCNAAKAAEYDLSPHELIGRRLGEVVPPAALDAVRRHLDGLVPEDPVRRIVLDGVDGRIEWVDQLQVGPDGDEVLSVGRDVTERDAAVARARELEHSLWLAMDDAPIGVALVGLDGRMRRVNQALCRFVGRSPDELLTMTTLDITHPDDVAADLALVQRVFEDGPGPMTLEKRYVLPDGSVVWGLLTVSLVRDEKGRPLNAIGQVVDITDRVEREADLERTAVTERDAARRLRDLDEMKNTFLTAVSHELRTPLTAVQGFAELLRRQHLELSPERLRDVIDRLAHNAERLGGLLTDLLDLDRLTSGVAWRPDLDRVHVDAVVRTALARVDTQGREVTADLAGVSVVADRAQLERVVENLLANAVRHTPDGTHIRVRVVGDGAGGTLTVEDDGPGVPDDLKPSVFDPFTMGGSEGLAAGGTGVGLAIVRGFVELHGGRVWVGDRPGGGAAFHVWMPAIPPEPDLRPPNEGTIGVPRS